MSFGILAPGSQATGSSVLWNVGATPLRIVRSIASCGCTAADDLTGRVIEPGGFTSYSTSMNMKSGLGPKREKITVYFDNGTYAVQYYTAGVALPVRVVPPYITASEQQPDKTWSHTMSGELEVTSTDGKPFRIIAAHGATPDIVGWIPSIDPPRSSYRIRWDLTGFEANAIPWFWVLETDRPDCPMVDVRIRHETTLPHKPRGRPWVPKDQRILVGEIANGVPFEVSTTIEYSHGALPNAERAGVFSQSDQLDAVADVQIDGQFLHFRILLTPRGAMPGLFYEQVAVYASGASAQLRLIGRITR